MTEYKDIDAVNWSTLRAMRVSPFHYKHRIDHPPEPTKAMRLGRALHTAILEPHEFESRHPIYPGPVRRGGKWEAFLDEHAGADLDDILIQTEAHAIKSMAQSVRGSGFACEHLRDGAKETILEWTDEDTGIACKGRCDSVNGHLVDVKTCNGSDFVPERFESHAIRFGYDGQMAFYADGLAAMGYEPDHGPALIVVESEEPYDCATYILKEEFIDRGRRLYQTLLRQLKECREANHWPGICGDGELHLGIPAWAEWEQFEDVKPITIGGVAFGGE